MKVKQSLLFFINELSCVLVPVPTKIFQLVASISWKSANYQYEPKFNYLLPVFCCCYLFVSLWHCSHMSLSFLSSDDGLIFSIFSFYGPLGLLLCLKSKKQSDSLVWWGVTISPTCMHISVRIFGWMVRSLDWGVH